MNFKPHLLSVLGVATALMILLASTLLKAVTPQPQTVPCQLLAQCRDGSTFVIFFQSNSTEIAELSRDVLDRLSRKTKPDRRVVVHRLKRQQVEPIYANIANGRRSLLELYPQLEQTPSY